jgi:hypothetical protein
MLEWNEMHDRKTEYHVVAYEELWIETRLIASLPKFLIRGVLFLNDDPRMACIGAVK